MPSQGLATAPRRLHGQALRTRRSLHIALRPASPPPHCLFSRSTGSVRRTRGAAARAFVHQRHGDGNAIEYLVTDIRSCTTAYAAAFCIAAMPKGFRDRRLMSLPSRVATGQSNVRRPAWLKLEIAKAAVHEHPGSLGLSRFFQHDRIDVPAIIGLSPMGHTAVAEELFRVRVRAGVDVLDRPNTRRG